MTSIYVFFKLQPPPHASMGGPAFQHDMFGNSPSWQFCKTVSNHSMVDWDQAKRPLQKPITSKSTTVFFAL